jgi:hypothetical protein
MSVEEMPSSEYDIVHTITDWYDGARAGVADLHGEPHYYEGRWDEAKGDWSEVYLLNRIDEETFRLAMEDWHIWKRWQAAFRKDTATQDTHPALPADRARHDELAEILASRLVIRGDKLIKAKAEFKYGEPTLVRWSIVP